VADSIRMVLQVVHIVRQPLADKASSTAEPVVQEILATTLVIMVDLAAAAVASLADQAAAADIPAAQVQVHGHRTQLMAVAAVLIMPALTKPMYLVQDRAMVQLLSVGM